jgi:radical SAM superfamily enzyme YgiQ (UPF0313 family)
VKYAEPIYRPPSERDSLLIQVTVGCSRPHCTFCFVSQQRKAFRVRPTAEVKQDIDEAAGLLGDTVESVFFLAGDPSVLRASALCELADHAFARLPRLKRISMYAHARDMLNKRPEELSALRRSGIEKLYIGIESGSDAVLQSVKKGVDAEEMAAGCKKALDHGFTLSVQIILGLGGRRLSREHALGTAAILSDISPHYVAALSLMIYPHTELGAAAQAGEFQPLEFAETLDELELLLEETRVQRPCVFRTNHPSNYLPIGGTLPGDREDMLRIIRAERERPLSTRAEIGRGL